MIVGPPSGLPSSPPGGVVGDVTALAQRSGLNVGNEVGAIGLVGRVEPGKDRARRRLHEFVNRLVLWGSKALIRVSEGVFGLIV